MENEIINLDTHKNKVKVITKIRNGRSRPCYQNIQTHLNRGEYNDLQMDDLKSVLDVMLGKNILQKIGEQNESFYVTEETENLKNDETNESTKSLESFVNEEFYSVIINRIKLEVNVAVEKALEAIPLPAVHDTKIYEESEFKLKDNKQKTLIENLNKQIEFLQNELVNKNEIIKTLINDKCVPNCSQTENTNVPTKAKNLESNPTIELTSNVMNEKNFNRVSGKSKKKSRSITMLGDSILKEVKSYKIRNGLTSNDRVYVKSFPGATIRDVLHEYAIPSMRHNTNLIALHLGTNDPRSINSPNDIAQEIIKLGMKLKSDEDDIMISGIVAWKDDKLLEDKRRKVNELLKIKTSELGFGFIEHNEIKPQLHCNYGGLHLNFDGTYILGSNFVKMINA